MGRAIVEQPNGKYAVWSTVVDDFIILDATENEVINFYVNETTMRVTEQVASDMNRLDQTYQMSHYLEIIKANQGDEKYQEIVKEITQ